tara:strand:- start:156 stop:461 length:306 start_codon:yes stop_codon:yes gene_type:complete
LGQLLNCHEQTTNFFVFHLMGFIIPRLACGRVDLILEGVWRAVLLIRGLSGETRSEDWEGLPACRGPAAEHAEMCGLKDLRNRPRKPPKRRYQEKVKRMSG